MVQKKSIIIFFSKDVCACFFLLIGGLEGQKKLKGRDDKKQTTVYRPQMSQAS